MDILGAMNSGTEEQSENIETPVRQSRLRALGVAVLVTAVHVALLFAGGSIIEVIAMESDPPAVLPTPPPWIGGVLTAVLGILAAAVAVSLWGRGIPQTIRELASPRPGREYLHGFFFALLTYFLSVLLALVVADIGFIPEEFLVDQDLFSLFPQNLILKVLLVAVLIPLVEEVIYRGVVLRRLLEAFSPGAAVFLSALIFGLIHADPMQSTYTFCMGLLIGWLMVRTGSLQLAVWVHIIFNLYGVILDALGMAEQEPWVAGVYSVVFLGLVALMGSHAVEYFRNYDKRDPESDVSRLM